MWCVNADCLWCAFLLGLLGYCCLVAGFVLVGFCVAFPVAWVLLCYLMIACTVRFDVVRRLGLLGLFDLWWGYVVLGCFALIWKIGV